MNKNRPVYVEFIGLPGSGKTTIMRSFANLLAEEGKEAVVADDVQVLRQRGRLFSIAMPIFLFPWVTSKIIWFWICNRAVFYDTEIGTPALGKRIQLVSLKRLIRDRLIVATSQCDYFLAEGVLHPISFFNHKVSFSKLDALRTVLPGTRRILVFIDTSPEDAFVRMRARAKRNNVYGFMEEQGEAWGLAYYQKTHARIEALYTYVHAAPSSVGFDSVIRIDGSLSPEHAAAQIQAIDISNSTFISMKTVLRAWLKMAALTALRILLPLSSKGVRVLMYHAVESRSGSKYSVSPEHFEKHLAYIAAHTRPVSLLEVSAHARGEVVLQDGSVAVTVDDGYADTYTTVFPLIKKYHIPLTVFLTSTLGSHPAFKGVGRITEAQVHEMYDSGLVRFEAHGKTHANLRTLIHDRELFSKETRGCADDIERMTGARPKAYAYASGHRDASVERMIEKEGFTTGFGITEGTVPFGKNPFVIPRIQIDGTMPVCLAKARITGPIDIYRRCVRLFS